MIGSDQSRPKFVDCETEGGADDPPLTRFLVEQLSTAHWFDQRRTRQELQWEPRVSLDEGFAELQRWYSCSDRRHGH